tara:strand:+ start:8420 stop:8536 length:117 start_codon:yes stop_codon:yes gene_type:complete
LSATIYQLRNDGYNIESEDIKVANRWGGITTVSKYILK